MARPLSMQPGQAAGASAAMIVVTMTELERKRLLRRMQRLDRLIELMTRELRRLQQQIEPDRDEDAG